MKKNIDLSTLMKDNIIDRLEKDGKLNNKIEKGLDIINNRLVHLIGNVQAGVINDVVPETQKINVGEHIINQSLISDAQKVFSSLYGQQEVITTIELKERKELFEKNILPVITQCTKDIYSLIK